MGFKLAGRPNGFMCNRAGSIAFAGKQNHTLLAKSERGCPRGDDAFRAS